MKLNLGQHTIILKNKKSQTRTNERTQDYYNQSDYRVNTFFTYVIAKEGQLYYINKK